MVSSNTARVTVQLPAEAKLYVNDDLCTLSSNVRSFKTPELAKNRKYFYDLRMEMVNNGKVETETRRIILEAGKHIRVNFGSFAPDMTVSR